MDTSTYLEHVRADAERMAATAKADLAADVPQCPGWTLGDLIFHTGEVHRFWTQILGRGLQDPREAVPTERPFGDLGDWLMEGSDDLVNVVSKADLEAPIWTWSHLKKGTFVPRRMAHETAVHRWDAQSVVGSPDAIDPQLAADGVDEFLELVIGYTKRPLGGNGETVHLHQTDGDGEWILHLEEDGPSVAHGHAKGDAAVRATGSDLILLLWRRVPASAVEVLGSREVLDTFLEWPDLT